MTAAPPLLDWARRRLLAAEPGLAAGHDLSTAPALRAAGESLLAERAAEESAGGGTLAVCVVAELDLPAWIRETCRWALGVAGPDGERWRRSFTRTVFLAGRPANLRERFAFGHTAEDGSAAWAGPAPAAATATLRRLLKTFEGPCPVDTGPDRTVELPGAAGSAAARPPVHRELHLATAGVTLAQALVHLNHLLAEAVLDGVIAAGDRLTVRRAPRLIDVRSPVAALRADTEPHHPDRLRAYALLTEES